MNRGILKNRELQWMKASEITKLSSNAEVLLASANQNNGYFLGYDNNSITASTNTAICSQLHENAYVESKIVSNEGLHFKLSKNYIYKDIIAEFKSVPSTTLENVILCNTYNNVTRYLGVSGTTVCSTQNQSEAATNDIYHWNLVYYSSGRFKLYNPKSSRYIYYSSNTSPYYNTNTSSTNLYFNYVNNSGFTIANANSGTIYYMRFNSNTQLQRQSNTAQYWHIYIPYVAPCPSSSGEVYSTTELSAMPTATVNDILLYDGTRYLGLTTGNTVTSTTSFDTASGSKYYHWNMTYYSSNRFKIENAQTTGRYVRYVRYSNNSFSISTTSTNLYFAYNSTNKFTIMGSNGSNWLYMSSNTALGRSTSARYWHIYKLEYRYPVEWKTPQTMIFNNLRPTNVSNIVAGYDENELISISVNNKMLCHGNNLSELYYYDTIPQENYQCTWLIFDKNQYIFPKDKPLEPEVKLVGARYYETGNTLNWTINYAYGDEQKFDLTITMLGSGRCGLLLHNDDGSQITATTIHWDSLTTTDLNGNAVTPSAVGWLTSTNDYTGRHLTNGGAILAASRTDAETGEVYESAIGLTAGASLSPTSGIIFTFKGVTLE